MTDLRFNQRESVWISPAELLTRTTIPAASVMVLRGTPYVVVPSVLVPANHYVIPFRAIVHKPAGNAYTVPNTTNLLVRIIGDGGNLLHIETDPVNLGAGVALDQAGECCLNANGPSFSWTGASQIQVPISPSLDYEGLGLELVNLHATVDISTATVDLTVWVYCHVLPIRPA